VSLVASSASAVLSAVALLFLIVCLFARRGQGAWTAGEHSSSLGFEELCGSGSVLRGPPIATALLLALLLALVHLVIVFSGRETATVARALDLTVLIALLCNGGTEGQAEEDWQAVMNAKCRDLDRQSKSKCKTEAKWKPLCLDSGELNGKYQKLTLI